MRKVHAAAVAVGVVLLTACGSGSTGRIPDRPITDYTAPVGYDCSSDQPTDPCIIQPEPTFP